jgi:hypothetical protein
VAHIFVSSFSIYQKYRDYTPAPESQAQQKSEPQHTHQEKYRDSTPAPESQARLQHHTEQVTKRPANQNHSTHTKKITGTRLETQQAIYDSFRTSILADVYGNQNHNTHIKKKRYSYEDGTQLEHRVLWYIDIKSAQALI